MSGSIEKITYRIFIFLLIFSPLAFGTVSTWSLTVMEAVSIGAALLLFISLGINHQTVYKAPGTVLVLIFPVYILVQLIPLPMGMVKLISPSTFSLYSETIGIVDPVSWVSLSINKKATLAELFRYLSYAGVYLLTVQLLSHRYLLKKTVNYLAIFATLLAVTAILQGFTSGNKIYWFYETPGSFFGPYFNNNHYAGLMEMIFPVIFALFLFYKPSVSYPSIREKIVEFFSQIRTSEHILLGFSSLLVAVSVFLSLSRGGIISLCISGGFCFLLVTLKQGTLRSSGITVVLLVCLLLISVGWFGWKPIFKEFENIRNDKGEITENRPIYWKDSVTAFKDFPITGTGMGTFGNIYPKYQSKSFGRRLTHAHNDYLEFLVNGGIVGFLLFFGIPLTIIWKSYKVVVKRREAYSIYISIGSICGILAILLHSITDFNLQIGANGLYLFFLCGLAVSASHTRLRDGLGNTLLKPMASRSEKLFYSGAVCMLLLVPIIVLINVGTIKGESLLFSAARLSAVENPTENHTEAIFKMEQKAFKFDPLDFLSPWFAAKSAVRMSDPEAALFYFKKAVHRNPAYGPLLQDFGMFLSQTGENEPAERLIRAGIKYNRISSVRYKTYAEWLLANGQKDRGIDTLRTAITLNVKKSRSYIDFMDEKGLNINEIRNALPHRVEPRIYLAEYLLDKGMQRDAERAYLDAFTYLDKEEEVSASCFFKASRYFEKQKQYDEALNIMLKGIEYLPDNAKIRVAAASLYERVGIIYRATEEYKHALILDPKNRHVRKKLKKLSAT
ncbi:MAG: O-antigen ligase family protein [Deltaproteobacteria bacterium]|nr:O-antigen ligase family protein [Deltaproteobacteria bacterium]